MIGIYVQTDIFEKEEICALTTNDISVDKVTTVGFLPETLIMFFLECGQNVGYAAIYDSLKYVVFAISNKLCKKNISEKQGSIVIIRGNQQCTIDFPYPLSEETFKEISLEVIKEFCKE